jgi:hypothetical protein
VHRLWAFVAGVPVGVLAALAWGRPGATTLELGALAGGVALAATVWVAGRLASHDDARGGHLARAASVGLAALPAAAAAWLGLAPGALASLALVVAALAFFLYRAARASGPAGGALRQAGSALAALGCGALVALVAAGIGARLGAGEAPAPEELARYAYDVDAHVALGPDPGCAPEVASVEPLGAGARPALDPAGAVLWYDAPSDDGRRQVYRLDRASGVARCWTCGEPGRNQRPRPTPNGGAIVFETDRHASGRAPLNWELHWIDTRGDEPRPSRRLTYDPAPDRDGALDPAGSLLVWSSGARGGYRVASAALERGHGGLLLGPPRELAPGGAAWVAPLAFAPDARTLVVVRGDPIGLQSALARDPATGREAALSRPGAHVAAASFSADGSVLALATTRPAAAARAVPAWLGFAVARVAALFGVEGARLRDTGLRIGSPWEGELADVPLPHVARYGAPTGLALEPDGRGVVLGQRRADGVERLVRLGFRCEGAPKELAARAAR